MRWWVDEGKVARNERAENVQMNLMCVFHFLIFYVDTKLICCIISLYPLPLIPCLALYRRCNSISRLDMVGGLSHALLPSLDTWALLSRRLPCLRITQTFPAIQGQHFLSLVYATPRKPAIPISFIIMQSRLVNQNGTMAINRDVKPEPVEPQAAADDIVTVRPKVPLSFSTTGLLSAVGRRFQPKRKPAPGGEGTSAKRQKIKLEDEELIGAGIEPARQEEKPFPFLRLAAELRNMVYKRLDTPAIGGPKLCSRVEFLPPIIRVSKQLRDEASAILLEDILFFMEVDTVNHRGKLDIQFSDLVPSLLTRPVSGSNFALSLEKWDDYLETFPFARIAEVSICSCECVSGIITFSVIFNSVTLPVPVVFADFDMSSDEHSFEGALDDLLQTEAATWAEDDEPCSFSRAMMAALAEHAKYVMRAIWKVDSRKAGV